MVNVGKYLPYMDPIRYTDLDISKQKTCISEFPPPKKKRISSCFKPWGVFFEKNAKKGHLHVGQVWVFHDFVSWWVDVSNQGPTGWGWQSFPTKTGGIIGGWQGTNLLPKKMNWLVYLVLFSGWWPLKYFFCWFSPWKLGKTLVLTTFFFQKGLKPPTSFWYPGYQVIYIYLSTMAWHSVPLEHPFGLIYVVHSFCGFYFIVHVQYVQISWWSICILVNWQWKTEPLMFLLKMSLPDRLYTYPKISNTRWANGLWSFGYDLAKPMIQLYSNCLDGLKPPPGILLTFTCRASSFLEHRDRRQTVENWLFGNRGGPTEGVDVHLIHNKY